MDRILKFGPIDKIDPEAYPSTTKVVDRVIDLGRSFRDGVKSIHLDVNRSDEGKTKAIEDLGKKFIGPLLNTIRCVGGLDPLHLGLQQAAQQYQFARFPRDDGVADIAKMLRHLQHRELREAFRRDNEKETERGLILIRMVASGEDPELVEAIVAAPRSLRLVSEQMMETAVTTLAEKRDEGVTKRFLDAHKVFASLHDATASVIKGISKAADLDPKGALKEMPEIEEHIGVLLKAAFMADAQRVGAA